MVRPGLTLRSMGGSGVSPTQITCNETSHDKEVAYTRMRGGKKRDTREIKSAEIHYYTEREYIRQFYIIGLKLERVGRFHLSEVLDCNMRWPAIFND